MKLAKLSLATIIALSTSAFAADSLETMFKDGKVSGEIRSMYINQDADAAAAGFANSDGVAVGGQLKFETAAYMGFKLGSAFYTTHGIAANNAVDMAGTSLVQMGTDDAYSVLGEAYVQYDNSNTMLKIGRQRLDTPLAGSDDIRIVPNMFEAYLLTNTDLADTTLVLAHVTKMFSATDGANTASFESMSDAAGVTIRGNDEAVTVAAAIYSGFADTTLQAWYYTLSGDIDAWYLQADYNWGCTLVDGMKMSGALQFIDYDIDNTIVAGGSDHNVWGAKIEGAHTSGFGFDVAYNNYSDDVMAAGVSPAAAWGGYAEFAVADEMWANSAMQDSDVWRIGASYDFAKNGVNGLTAEVAYVAFDNQGNNTDVDVLDFIVSYDVQAIANLSTYVVYEDRSADANNADSDLLKLYVGYTF